ncbi:MAG: hypothetical protein P8H19_02645 [Polaribacter sp.]|nr:hypothetical protein [Polaribacter sp.]
MTIVLYGKQGHAYTVAFKNFLNSTDVPYIYIKMFLKMLRQETTAKNFIMAF